MNKVTFYRATETPNFMGGQSFTNYGDTIAIRESYDTDVVYNLTTGKNYTYGAEQGTKIESNEFPLTNTEKKNLEAFGLQLNWLAL